MRIRMSDLEAVLRRVPVLGVVVLLAGVLGGCAGGPLRPGFQSPPATPTQALSPLDTPTAPPKPTETPVPTPTHTPVPTPLPLPTSAYHALWVDTISWDIPGGPEGTIWLADPNDVGHRQAIVHWGDQEIYHAAVAPDGRQVAFTAAPWGAPERPLWIVNIRTGDRTQLLPNADQVRWSHDGHALAYTANEAPAGTALQVVDMTTRESRRLTSVEAGAMLDLLGWSSDDQKIYYIRPSPQSPELGSELWAIGQDGLNAHKIASLGDRPGSPVLSPDGSKFLIGSPEGLAWISADGHDQHVITQPTWGFTATWAPDSQGLVISRWEANRSNMVVQVVDVTTQSTKDLGVITPIGNWQLLALSPDRNWLAAYHHYTGLYWLHLPTGTAIPVPTQGRITFLGWVPRPSGS